jgi:ribonuclease P protein component
VGWALPRAVGNSVLRNKLKRWVREHLRLCGEIKAQKDVVLYFRVPRGSKNLSELTHKELSSSLGDFFEKLS